MAGEVELKWGQGFQSTKDFDRNYDICFSTFEGPKFTQAHILKIREEERKQRGAKNRPDVVVRFPQMPNRHQTDLVKIVRALKLTS